MRYPPLVLVCFAVLGTACRDDYPEDPDGLSPDAGLTGDPCEVKRPSGAFDRLLTHEGLERYYKLVVPASYDASATPLVLNLHGFTSNALQQELFSQMTPKAEEAGFLLVYPEGTPGGDGALAWNGGVCCGGSTANDVGFLAAVLDEVASEYCVDPDRVYATGMSNGGFMSHRLGCELSERIAAIAPVAGVLGISNCQPTRPVPVMHFHGTEDSLVPYEGSTQFVGARETVEVWAGLNGCTGEPAQSFQKGDSTCLTWSSCEGGAEVTLCTVDGGGHTWPGGLEVSSLGHTTMDLEANDAIWEFFTRHPRAP